MAISVLMSRLRRIPQPPHGILSFGLSNGPSKLSPCQGHDSHAMRLSLSAGVSQKRFSHNSPRMPTAVPLSYVQRPLQRPRLSTNAPGPAISTIFAYNQKRHSNATQQSQNLTGSPLEDYKPPTAGMLSYLPPKILPYAELVRLDKPAGTYYLFLPCLFSTLMAAPLTTTLVSPWTIVYYNVLFMTGALIMRGAGCTINDLWDRNLDPHVARTRLRPIARKAISPQAAIAFTGFQMLAGLGLLLQFPYQCVIAALPSVLLVASYPLAKRVTYYPQFVLGLTFSWGAFLGFPTLGIDLLSNSAAATSATLLYASCVSWTVLYDMIYAHMDVKDDAKAGIKSIALRHEKETKPVLVGLAVAQVGLLAASGAAVGAGPIFFIGSCGGAAITLAHMIWKVKLKEVQSCWWWFKNGCWLTGGAISLGLVGEYLAHLMGWYKEDDLLFDGEAEN